MMKRLIPVLAIVAGSVFLANPAMADDASTSTSADSTSVTTESVPASEPAAAPEPAADPVVEPAAETTEPAPETAPAEPVDEAAPDAADSVEPAPPVESPDPVVAAPSKAAALEEVGTLDAAVAAAKPPKDEKAAEPHKVFVCKYVGTPGDGEVLQTGDNPISVDIHAIPDFQGVGSFFADKQGRSYVLAFDTGQPEPDPSLCPTGNVTIPVTPVTPTVTPPTCEAAGTLVVPTTTGVIYTVTPELNGPGTYNVTAAANTDAGYVLAEGAVTAFGPFEVLAQLTGVENCPTVSDEEVEQPTEEPQVSPAEAEAVLPDTGGSELWLLLVSGVLGTAGMLTLSMRRFMH
jgi:hypothetical protein